MLDAPAAFVLLTTDPDSGRQLGLWAPGLVGTVLLELLEGGCVQREDDRLHTTPVRPLQPAALEAWRAIAERPRPRRTSWWVHQLAARNAREWHTAIARELVTAGALREEARRPGQLRFLDAGDGSREALLAELRLQRDAASPDPVLAGLLTAIVDCNAGGQLGGDRGERLAWRRAPRDWRRTGLLPDDVTAVCDAVREAVAALSAG